ncbi:MAG: nitrogen fixation protein NifX [Rhodospirillaceae bacterium]|nr:nitrogen fixation protein NifX [Rhodospirillaceae bacterium]
MAARRLRLIDTEETMSQPAEKPLRVAIATQDMARLNAHFGSAKTFAIYDVTSTTSAFVEAVGFDDVADESGSHSPLDDRITPKVDALNGCNLLFVLAIGGPAAAKVVRANVHPIKVKEPEPIADVLARVQTMLAGSPPPWLRKILGRNEQRSMDFLEDEVA